MRKISLLTITYLALFWACKEADPLVDPGKDILDSYGEICNDTLYAVADTFLVKGKVNTANSSKLLLGFYKDFESRFLIKFDKFPADTIAIDSLKMRLTSFSSFPQEAGSIRGKIYLVTNEWQESVNSDVDWDYRDNIDYSPETSADFEMVSEDSATFLIDLPTGLVDIWRDTTAGNRNFGLLFDYSEVQQIIEITSSETFNENNLPKLIFIYRNTALDSTVKDTSIATMDASVIEYNGTFNPENVYIAAGYIVNAFIAFDFSLIPENAILSSVDLFLKQDSDNSIINTNKGSSFYLRNVVTDYDQLPYYRIDSTFITNLAYNVLLSEDDDKQLRVINSIRPNIAQNFIQSIINKDIKHGSFYLEYTNQANEISVYAIRHSADPAIFIRPKIVVEYYLLPSSRI